MFLFVLVVRDFRFCDDCRCSCGCGCGDGRGVDCVDAVVAATVAVVESPGGVCHCRRCSSTFTSRSSR